MQVDYAPAALKIISLLRLSKTQSELIRDPGNVGFILRAADLFATDCSGPATISCCTLIHSGLDCGAVVLFPLITYFQRGFYLHCLPAAVTLLHTVNGGSWQGLPHSGRRSYADPSLEEKCVCLSGDAKFHLATLNHFDRNVFASDAVIQDRGAK